MKTKLKAMGIPRWTRRFAVSLHLDLDPFISKHTRIMAHWYLFSIKASGALIETEMNNTLLGDDVILFMIFAVSASHNCHLIF